MSTDDPGSLSFYAYFHQPEELAHELKSAGFLDVQLFAVEGAASLLGDVPQRLQRPGSRRSLLALLAEHESDTAMIGISSHILATARNATGAAPNPGREA